MRQIVNERIKSFLADPTLYRTTVVFGDREECCYTWADGDDIQSAEDISVVFLASVHGVDADDFMEVTTETVGENK